MQAPEDFHLGFGERRSHRGDSGDARPLAGDDVHIAFDHHQGAALSARVQQLARLGQAIE